MEINSKRAKVIILPTKDKAAPILKYKGNNSLQYFPNTYWSNEDLTKQHLYITTDDKIEEGDWTYWQEFEGSILQIKSIDADYVWFTDKECLRSYQINKVCKKIIATTDDLLITPYKWEAKDKDSIRTKLPQPSQAFVQKYVELGSINEVLVEYTQEWYDENSNINLIPKIDSHNTITIHPVKDSWNREELFNIVNNKITCESQKAFLNSFIEKL